jgi:hypothetical protein
MNRRALLLAGAAACIGGAAVLGRRPAAAAQHFEVSLTPEEWRKRLTPAQFEILRQQGTEPPWTSPLLNEHRAGVFACACRTPWPPPAIPAISWSETRSTAVVAAGTSATCSTTGRPPPACAIVWTAWR